MNPTTASRGGPRCPECNVPLSWPGHTSGHHELHCPNGHYICTMQEFRQAAYELAMVEEFQLHRAGLARKAG
ncbi:hypothetical protein GCM10010082_07690 [Kushneria pakistanensis]|uniref:C2H2-type domain-containing protein n=1 Tax=Kushneria pakistanensis TaxID=1508770 RepID=A0ABQ3FCX6_9GAMM|nr:hypothetical protein GCM10010082_07690 [Kushneria pakistanensis]